MTLHDETLQPALRLGGLSLLGLGLVSLIHWGVENRIAANHTAALCQHIESVVPPGLFDNDPLAEAVNLTEARLQPAPATTIYPVRQQGRPVAWVIPAEAPDGYSGTITLLVAVAREGHLLGVRTLSHRETPGLGDKIEAEKSDWIRHFQGLALGNPPLTRWAVKRDGGDFDQFAGATITPRAVVKAVKKTLMWYEQHREWLGP